MPTIDLCGFLVLKNLDVQNSLFSVLRSDPAGATNRKK